jgi:hypothetical protein
MFAMVAEGRVEVMLSAEVRPNFVMVGAPKCGTTSMAQYLDQHPDIYMVRGEPHYFGSDIEYNRPRLTSGQYRQLFLPSRGKAIRGERSTWYLYSQNAASEIYDCNPDALIIAMLRNPADMLHSLHSHYVQRGRRDDIDDFAKALAAEPARRGQSAGSSPFSRELVLFGDSPVCRAARSLHVPLRAGASQSSADRRPARRSGPSLP